MSAVNPTSSGGLQSGDEADAAGVVVGARFSGELMHAAAILYYLEDETQSTVAQRLGVSRATVSRLLSEARRRGIVRIEVVDPTQPAPDDLGSRTAEALGLRAVYVAPPSHESVLGASLSAAVSEALSRTGLVADDVLLVSSGRTVWEVGRYTLPRFPGVIVAPAVGGQDEPEAWYQTNEITRQIADKIGGRPTFLFAPAQPGPSLYDQLLEEPSIRRVLGLWQQATCALLAVGAPPKTRSSMPGFVPREAQALAAAAGDICTRFFDVDGNELQYPGSNRLLATTHEMFKTIPHTIAVAVGTPKVPSLLGGARAGWFNTLVTDAPTAAALLAATG